MYNRLTRWPLPIEYHDFEEMTGTDAKFREALARSDSLEPLTTKFHRQVGDTPSASDPQIHPLEPRAEYSRAHERDAYMTGILHGIMFASAVLIFVAWWRG
jgi:hypothetical protein